MEFSTTGGRNKSPLTIPDEDEIKKALFSIDLGKRLVKMGTLPSSTKNTGRWSEFQFVALYNKCGQIRNKSKRSTKH
ncbi:hypothetical protein PIB30_024185 [Stylosanthes scabra]|uniref:Uncharacterized protein n=1 Tax=Stylosanthes scabra TaxID=79078 RepID=A0ABU6Z8P9_9FABA|nr:hypothetical protein [Stylosanthes scabra]